MKRKIAIGLTIVLALTALIGIIWTPYDPDQMNILLKNAAPSLGHPFGNDYYGRDVLSRVMCGLSTTFMISVSVLGIGSIFGIMIGALTGYFGGWFDEIIMRMNDTLTAFPSILLALIFVSAFGSGERNVIFALGILFIPSIARVVRSEYVKEREMDYVKNARILGASHIRIIFIHILPNIKAILIPTLAIGINNAVLAEAGMSYLGLGVQPPTASLGRMISEAGGYLQVSPWSAIFPGIAIILLIFTFSLYNDK